MAESDVREYWPELGIDSLQEVTCKGPTGSLAADVVERFLPNYLEGGSRNIGGNLEDMDIKRMDALQVIKMSLIEYSAKNNLNIHEPTVDADGKIKFIEVGANLGARGEVYSEIRSFSFVEDCSGVMVYGGKPRPYRLPLEWIPIWGYDEEDKIIYSHDFMVDNCNKPNFLTQAYILFPDPHLKSGTAYKDNITSLLEKESTGSIVGNALNDPEIGPWVKIMGYARFIDPKENATKETEIIRNNTARAFIQIGKTDPEDEEEPPNMGNLQKRETIDPTQQAGCYVWQEQNLSFNDAVEVKIDNELRYETVRNVKKDNLIGISNVYLVGDKIDVLWSRPISKEAETKPNPTEEDVEMVGIFLNDQRDTVRLSPGEHYTVLYEGEDADYKTPYIIFANLARPNDPERYGTGVDLIIDEESFIRPGETLENVTVFPISHTQGMLVKQIFVELDLDSPSIVVKDPDGRNERAKKIAEELIFNVAAMAVVERPGYIAFCNGATPVTIDQSESIKDHDPTEAQNFTESDLELAEDKMSGGGGITVNFSFLKEERDVQNAAKAIYDYMISAGGEIITYVYGPDAEVELGGYAPSNNGLVVNEVRYSYNDSNSYTISVNCGPYLAGGLTDVTGGPTPKMAEDFSGTGTIIEDAGNHIHYRVRIDGFGERVAINMCPKILRVGDQVSVTIHNNPVEA